jgi:hypothetical protein
MRSPSRREDKMANAPAAEASPGAAPKNEQKKQTESGKPAGEKPVSGARKLGEQLKSLFTKADATKSQKPEVGVDDGMRQLSIKDRFTQKLNSLLGKETVPADAATLNKIATGEATDKLNNPTVPKSDDVLAKEAVAAQAPEPSPAAPSAEATPPQPTSPGEQVAPQMALEGPPKKPFEPTVDENGIHDAEVIDSVPDAPPPQLDPNAVEGVLEEGKAAPAPQAENKPADIVDAQVLDDPQATAQPEAALSPLQKLQRDFPNLTVDQALDILKKTQSPQAAQLPTYESTVQASTPPTAETTATATPDQEAKAPEPVKAADAARPFDTNNPPVRRDPEALNEALKKARESMVPPEKNVYADEDKPAQEQTAQTTNPVDETPNAKFDSPPPKPGQKWDQRVDEYMTEINTNFPDTPITREDAEFIILQNEKKSAAAKEPTLELSQEEQKYCEGILDTSTTSIYATGPDGFGNYRAQDGQGWNLKGGPWKGDFRSSSAAKESGNPSTAVEDVIVEAVQYGPAKEVVKVPFKRQVTTGTIIRKTKEVIEDVEEVRDRPTPPGQKPLITVSYTFDTRLTTEQGRRDLPSYITPYDSRDGAMMELSWTMPEDKAKELIAKAQEDPELMRKLADQTMRKHGPQAYKEDQATFDAHWQRKSDHGIKRGNQPPWADWPADRMHFFGELPKSELGNPDAIDKTPPGTSHEGNKYYTFDQTHTHTRAKSKDATEAEKAQPLPMPDVQTAAEQADDLVNYILTTPDNLKQRINELTAAGRFKEAALAEQAMKCQEIFLNPQVTDLDKVDLSGLPNNPDVIAELMTRLEAPDKPGEPLPQHIELHKNLRQYLNRLEDAEQKAAATPEPVKPAPAQAAGPTRPVPQPTEQQTQASESATTEPTTSEAQPDQDAQVTDAEKIKTEKGIAYQKAIQKAFEAYKTGNKEAFEQALAEATAAGKDLDDSASPEDAYRDLARSDVQDLIDAEADAKANAEEDLHKDLAEATARAETIRGVIEGAGGDPKLAAENVKKQIAELEQKKNLSAGERDRLKWLRLLGYILAAIIVVPVAATGIAVSATAGVAPMVVGGVGGGNG